MMSRVEYSGLLLDGGGVASPSAVGSDCFFSLFGVEDGHSSVLDMAAYVLY